MDIWSVAVFVCITIVALELSWVLQRGVAGYRGYFLLLCVDAALLGVTIAEPRFAAGEVGPWPELVAGVALCGLLLVPHLLQALGRRALAADRIDLAARLASWRELLQPGLVATTEREMLADLAEARAGRLDAVMQRLRERLSLAEPPEDEALHDRIVTTLGVAGRYREAAGHFAAHLAADPARHPGATIQAVRAFGYLDELPKAAALVQRIEEQARVGHPGALAAIAQVRLMFLAFVGGPESIERLLALPGLARLPPGTRRMLREMAAHRPAGVPPESANEEVSRFARSLAQRVAAEHSGELHKRPSPPLVTWCLIALNVAAYAAFVVLGKRIESGVDLTRAGASFHAAVKNGEWWRLWTAMFLHGGLLHLLLNMLGLLTLGRVVEGLFGRSRFVLLYAAAGLAGNLASVWNPSPSAVLSVGASGAVLGLLGALWVMLRQRPRMFDPEWRRSVLGRITLLVALQIVLGFRMERIDNFAHLGGLLGGAAAGLLLLPEGILGRRRRGWVLVAIALGGVTASAALSVLSLVRSRPAATLAALPRRLEHVGAVHLTVPIYAGTVRPDPPEWPGEVAFFDEILDLAVTPHLVPPADAAAGAGRGPVEAALRACMERDRLAIARQTHEGDPVPPVEPATAPAFAGWLGLAQDEGGPHAQRMLYYGRAAPGGVLVVEPTAQGRGPLGALVEAELARVLASTGLDGETAPPPAATPAPAPAVIPSPTP